jgi:hypothetical protein
VTKRFSYVTGLFGLVTVLASLAFAPRAQSNSAPALVRVSGPSPFAHCEVILGDGEINYLNAEVEPWIASNPEDPDNLIGVWQQDRFQIIGSRDEVTGVSHDGGKRWTRTFPHFSRCAGGNAKNGGDYERSTDPWVTFSPNGTANQITLSLDLSDPLEAILVSRSNNGGDQWSQPKVLLADTDPNVFDDKPSITADSNDSRLVYAVWDRVDANVTPNLGPTWFARSTNGGNSWEPARSIYDPGPDAQTIANQIVSMPNGDLIDFFALQTNQSTSPATMIAVIRSDDKGLTWSNSPVIIDTLQSVGITDVKTGALVRTGDIIPDIAVDRGNGTLYIVWRDARFSGDLRDGIALSESVDGGMNWTAPVQVNQVPAVQAFTASVDVANDGTIGINYYDFRKDNSDHNVLLTNYWQITSRKAGGPWREVPLGGSFDMLTAPFDPVLGYFLGDYEGLAHAGNSFVPFFANSNSGKPANPTDVFVAAPGEGDTSTNGHVEVNSNPLPLAERLKARRWKRQLR